MSLKEELRLIREGTTEETTGLTLETSSIDIGQSMLEAAMDMCLMESDDPEVMIEAALGTFDKIGMMLFNKFNKFDELAKEDVSKFVSLEKEIKAANKEIYYNTDVDINNISKICRLMLEVYNDAISGKKVFEVLSNIEAISRTKFMKDETALHAMMDGDIADAKKLLAQANVYKKIKSVTYVVSAKNMTPIDQFIKNKHQVIVDMTNARNRLKTEIDKYRAAIKGLKHPNVIAYRMRLTALVTKAINNSIFILNQNMKLYMIVFNEEKRVYNQIKAKI